MKILVFDESNLERVVEVSGPLKIVEGEYLNRLVDQDGVEHFFTKEGYYDGWGRPVTEGR